MGAGDGSLSPYILNICMCRSRPHNLFKSEHTAIVIAAYIGLSAFVRIGVFGVEELDGVKTAAINIKMDIAFLEIRRTGFPYFCVGMQMLYLVPAFIPTDPFAVLPDVFRRTLPGLSARVACKAEVSSCRSRL